MPHGYVDRHRMVVANRAVGLHRSAHLSLTDHARALLQLVLG